MKLLSKIVFLIVVAGFELCLAQSGANDLEALSATNAQTRVDAIQRLIQSGDIVKQPQKTLPALLQALRDADDKSKSVTLYALALMAESGCITNLEVIRAYAPELITATTNGSADSKALALQIISQTPLSKSDVLPILKRSIDSSDFRVRKAGFSGLARMADRGDEEALNILLRETTNSSKSIRLSAVTALGIMKKGFDPVLTALVNRLADSENQIRLEAISSLDAHLRFFNYDTPIVFMPLFSLAITSKEDREIKNAAAALAAKMLNHAPENIEWVTEKFKAGLPVDMRRDIIRILCALSNPPPAAITQIKSALNDADTETKKLAQATLKRLGLMN